MITCKNLFKYVYTRLSIGNTTNLCVCAIEMKRNSLTLVLSLVVGSSA